MWRSIAHRGRVAGACLSPLRGASADVDAGAAQHRLHAAPARPNRNAAAVGDAAPHCQSFDLSPRAGGGQAQAVRDRTAGDGFLLLGDGADSAREVRVGVRSRSALDAAMVFGTRVATRFLPRRGLIPQPVVAQYTPGIFARPPDLPRSGCMIVLSTAQLYHATRF